MNKTFQKMILSGKTVFSVQALGKYFNELDDTALRKKISYYVKNGYLERLTKGLYSLAETSIDSKELANSMYSPSYISFETALYYHGMIFQADPSQVDLAYKKSDVRVLKNLDVSIHLRCLKTDILLSPEGLIYKKNFTIASPERAFLDMIYLNKYYYFDTLDVLDLNVMREILPIYKRKILMRTRVQSYFSNF